MLNSGSLVAGISFIILVNTSCHSRSVPMHADFRSIIAATDDTVHGYAIMILKSHRFAYTITDGTQQPTVKREFYHGTWQYQTDTLFLHYLKKRPLGVADYLVKETTGGWLIQFFTDGRARIFLRELWQPIR
jgi:hypothetical protein